MNAGLVDKTSWDLWSFRWLRLIGATRHQLQPKQAETNSRFADIKAIQRAQEELNVAENNGGDEEELEVSENKENCIVV